MNTKRFNILWLFVCLPAIVWSAAPGHAQDDEPSILVEEAGEDESWDDEWEDAGEYEPPPPPEEIYTLERCIEETLKHNPGIKAAHWEVQFYDARADEAWWAWFPKIRLSTYVAPSPDWERISDPPLNRAGQPAALPSYDTGEWYEFGGVIWGARAELTQPLYTFGKYTTLRDMGKLGREGAPLGKAAVTNRLIFEVKRAYYTLQLMEKSLDVLDNGMTYVDDAMKKLNELLEEGAETVTEADRYKFEVVRSDLYSRMAEARRGRAVVTEAMRMLMNLTPENGLYLSRRFPDLPQESVEHLREGPKAVSEMRRIRPDYRLLDIELQVAEKELEHQRAYYWPDFFLRLQYEYVTSSNIDAPDYPFLNKGMDHHYIAGLVGLTYTFDLPLQMSRVRQKEAKLNKTRAMREMRQKNMALETRKAWLEYQESLEQYQIAKEGRDSGKQWMVSALMNYNLGLNDTSSVVEAIAAYFKTEFKYYGSINSVKMARAELEYRMGIENERFENGGLDLPE